MQKVADPADISVLFFLAGANFWAILGHFWAIFAILGHFWAILGNFGSFLGHFFMLFFLAKNVSLLFLLLFASLLWQSAQGDPILLSDDLQVIDQKSCRDQHFWCFCTLLNKSVHASNISLFF